MRPLISRVRDAFISINREWLFPRLPEFLMSFFGTFSIYNTLYWNIWPLKFYHTRNFLGIFGMPKQVLFWPSMKTHQPLRDMSNDAFSLMVSILNQEWQENTSFKRCKHHHDYNVSKVYHGPKITGCRDMKRVRNPVYPKSWALSSFISLPWSVAHKTLAVKKRRY